MAELMIGVAIGFVVLTAVFSVYTETVKSSRETLSAAKLNQELRTVASLIAEDVRRAGYWGTATAADSSKPFERNFNSDGQILTVLDYGGRTGACVLYTYDRNGNGTINADEWLGFRRSSDGASIEMVASVTGTPRTDDCTTGWTFEPLTDTTVTITDLTFDTTQSTCRNLTDAAKVRTDCASKTGDTADDPIAGDHIVQTRVIEMNLAGRLTNDASVTAQINTHIRVRNDRFYTIPSP